MSRELAERILGAVGGRPNILQVASCMTRLRLKLRDVSLVRREELSIFPGVLGVVEAGEQLQIVLGPGKVKLVATEMEKLVSAEQEENPVAAHAEIGHAAELKATIAARNRTPLKQFLGRLAAVFVPLIPAIVASGMVAGLTNVAVRLGADPACSLVQILNVVGWGVFNYLAVFVGFQTAKEFGGTPALGGLAGVLLINPAIVSIQIDGMSLIPGRGGVFGVLLVAGFMAWLEQRIRRYVPQSVDIIVTPTITLLLGGLVTYYILQPVSGVLSDGTGRLYCWYDSGWNFFAFRDERPSSGSDSSAYGITEHDARQSSAASCGNGRSRASRGIHGSLRQNKKPTHERNYQGGVACRLFGHRRTVDFWCDIATWQTLCHCLPGSCGGRSFSGGYACSVRGNGRIRAAIGISDPF